MQSRDAISIEELQECDNLNPYKDWFMSILSDANTLIGVIDSEFIEEIEALQ